MQHAIAPARRRRQSFTARTTRWARRHPVLVRVLVVMVGVGAAWACEYATGGAALALCKLRLMMAEKLGAAVEQLLHAKGAAG